MDQSRPEASILFVWTESCHCFGAQGAKPQCFYSVISGVCDVVSGCCVFTHVNHPSASCFAVVSAASSRIASSSFIISLTLPRMTFSGIILFFNLDSTAKIVQQVMCMSGTFSESDESVVSGRSTRRAL